jgi:hypothetical protein
VGSQDAALLRVALSMTARAERARAVAAHAPALLARCASAPSALVASIGLVSELLSASPDGGAAGTTSQLWAAFMALDVSATAHELALQPCRRRRSDDALQHLCVTTRDPPFAHLCRVAARLESSPVREGAGEECGARPVAGATCAVLQAVALATPAGAARVHALAALGCHLFDLLPVPTLDRVSTAHACAALAVLSSIAPGGGLAAPGSDAYLTTFASSALATLARHEHAVAAGSLTLQSALVEFLCAVALAGECAPVCAGGPDRAAFANGRVIGAADTRAWAAHVLGGLRATPLGSGLAAMTHVLQRHCLSPAMLRPAAPGTQLLVRQMRAWQLVAALACSLAPAAGPAGTAHGS